MPEASIDSAFMSAPTPSTSSTTTDTTTTTTTPKKAFAGDDVSVIFVLGGPGVGKGTQCAKLVSKYHFVHLSAGDLLREEQARSGSEYGQLIADYIKSGQIVPMEITIKLLENAMKKNFKEGKSRFLIDGFPRKMDQGLKFEEDVSLFLFFHYYFFVMISYFFFFHLTNIYLYQLKLIFINKQNIYNRSLIANWYFS